MGTLPSEPETSNTRREFLELPGPLYYVCVL
jgi:hypothetical protein